MIWTVIFAVTSICTSKFYIFQVPSPLGSKPAFPWGLQSPHLPPGVVSTQPLGFSSHANSISTGVPGVMQAGVNVPGSMAAGAGVGASQPAPCPYVSAPSAASYALYNRDSCSNSIASLRLKAKQHSGVTGVPAGFGYAAVPTRQPSTLSACQYAVGNGTGMV